MNKISKILFLALIYGLFVGLFASCEESKSAAFVYGKVEVRPGGNADFHGSLDETGKADVYGSCEKKGDSFNFTVGHGSSRDIEGAVPPTGIYLYLSISGVAGNPTEGVYDLSNASDLDPEPKEDEDLHTTFETAVIKTTDGVITNQWNVNAEDAECMVDLFAVPVEGELIFEDDLNKTFDYYVSLECYAIPGSDDDSGEDLNTFRAEMFFENCD